MITWARFYESFGEIGMDCGVGEVLPLDEKEVQDRLDRTTAEWPIAKCIFPDMIASNACLPTCPTISPSGTETFFRS